MNALPWVPVIVGSPLVRGFKVLTPDLATTRLTPFHVPPYLTPHRGLKSFLRHCVKRGVAKSALFLPYREHFFLNAHKVSFGHTIIST